MAQIKNTRIGEDVEKGEILGRQTNIVTLEINIHFLMNLYSDESLFIRKLGLDLPQDLALPLLSMYPKNSPSYHTCSIMFVAVLVTIVEPGNNIDVP